VKATASRIGRPDSVGFVLLSAWLAWIGASAFIMGADPSYVLLSIVLTALAFVVARLLALRSPLTVPSIVVAVAAVVVGLYSTEILSGYAYSPPLGYSNANAAFFVQASIAALMLVFAARSRAMRVAGIGGALLFAAVPIASGVTAGVVLILGLPAGALIVHRLRGRRTAVIACAASAAFVFTMTLVLALSYRPSPEGGLVGLATRVLSENRLRLWNEALVIIADHAVFGVGPGGFQTASPTAMADADLRWAHNGFLQHGAESGLPAMGFLIAVPAWAFARLGAARGGGRLTVLAAAALAAAASHASVDYILHFPVVPIVTAALVSSGSVVRHGVYPATASPRSIVRA
jgi:O-antigen ligase